MKSSSLIILLMVTTLLLVIIQVAAVEENVKLIDGCDLAYNKSNTNLRIPLSASPPATRLLLRFADCTLHGVAVALVAPNSDSTEPAPSNGTLVVLERFTMRGGSFVITPAVPLASDSATRPLVENIVVTAKDVVMDRLSDALVVDVAATAKSNTPFIVVRNVGLSVSNASFTSPSGNAVSIVAGDGIVAAIRIDVMGPAVIAATRLAASVEASGVNNASLVAQVATGPVSIAAGVNSTSSGVGALGIVRHRPYTDSKINTLWLTDVLIEAGDEQIDDDSSGSNRLAIAATAKYCAAAAGVCCVHEGNGRSSQVTLSGSVLFQATGSGLQLHSHADITGATTVGVTVYAYSAATITISAGANVSMLGRAAHDGSILATANNVAAAVGMALYTRFSTSIVTIKDAANLTMLGWAVQNGSIRVTTTYAAAAVGITPYSNRQEAIIGISAQATVTLLGWATQNGSIHATANAAPAAAVGMALYSDATYSILSVFDAATVTLLGWASESGSIQATAGFSAAAAAGMALAGHSSASATVSPGATVTLVGFATQSGLIWASAAKSASSVVGIAMLGMSRSTGITISKAATVTMLGWAAQRGSIQATAHVGTTTAVGMVFHSASSKSLVAISPAANVTMQGWALENGTIQATATDSIAAAVGIALYASDDASITISELATVTMSGWAAQHGAIHANAIRSQAAAAVGIAPFSSSSTLLSISKGGVLVLLGRATDDGSIRATSGSSGHGAAAVGIAFYATTASDVTISRGAAITLLGWVAGNGVIESDCARMASAAVGVALHSSRGQSTISIPVAAKVTLLGWAADHGSILAVSRTKNSAAALGLVSQRAIDADGTVKVWFGASQGSNIRASVSTSVATAVGLVSDSIRFTTGGSELVYCHDNTSSASVSQTANSAVLASQPAASLLSITNSSTLLTSGSPCAEEARRLAEVFQTHADSAERLLNSSMQRRPQLFIEEGDDSSPPPPTNTPSIQPSATSSLPPSETLRRSRTPSEAKIGSKSITHSATQAAAEPPAFSSATLVDVPSMTETVVPTPEPPTIAPPAENVSSSPEPSSPPSPIIENEGPEPVKKLSESSRVATQVSTTTVSVGASMASSTTAAADLQSVMVAMQALGDCGGGGRGAGGVGEAGNGALVPFTIGNSATQGVYGLLVLCVGGVLLNLFLVALARALKRDNSQCWGAGRFPSVAIRLFDYAYQGLAIEVLRVLTKRKFELVDVPDSSASSSSSSSSSNSGFTAGTTAYIRVDVTTADQAVAAATLILICIALPAAMNAAIVQPKHFERLDAEFVPFRHVFTHSPRMLKMFVLPTGFWTSPLKRQLGALFSSFASGEAFRWFLFSYVRALAIAVAVVAIDSCVAKISCLAAVIFVSLAAKLVLRVQRLRLTLTLSVLNDGILLAMIVAGSVAANDGATVALGVAAMGVSVLGTVATVVLKLRVEKQWRRKEQLLAQEENAAGGGGSGSGASVPMLAMPSSTFTDTSSTDSGSVVNSSSSSDDDTASDASGADETETPESSTVANPLRQG